MPRAKKRPASTKSDSRPAILPIAEFARHLYLSSWTVSPAINGQPGMNEQTRRRVFEATDQPGFRPNPLARGLGRSTRSRARRACRSIRTTRKTPVRLARTPQAIRLLTDHLFRLEHARFGQLGPGKNDVWRRPALVEIARQRGLDPDEIFVAVPERTDIERSIERGPVMAQTVLEMKRRFTALRR